MSSLYVAAVYDIYECIILYRLSGDQISKYISRFAISRRSRFPYELLSQSLQVVGTLKKSGNGLPTELRKRLVFGLWKSDGIPST